MLMLNASFFFTNWLMKWGFARLTMMLLWVGMSMWATRVQVGSSPLIAPATTSGVG